MAEPVGLHHDQEKTIARLGSVLHGFQEWRRKTGKIEPETQYQEKSRVSAGSTYIQLFRKRRRNGRRVWERIEITGDGSFVYRHNSTAKRMSRSDRELAPDQVLDVLYRWFEDLGPTAHENDCKIMDLWWERIEAPLFDEPDSSPIPRASTSRAIFVPVTRRDCLAPAVRLRIEEQIFELVE